MNARRLVVSSMASLSVLSGGLALVGVQAQAEVIHNYLSQITEVPSVGPHGESVALPGPLQQMESVTIDSGHIWIAELFGSSSRIDEFDAATGAFLSQPIHAEGPTSYNEGGIAIGHATGEQTVYVGEYVDTVPAVGTFDEAGTQLGTWTGADTPSGTFGSRISDVVVDDSTSLTDWAAGDVYVAASGQKDIDVFRPEAGGKEKYVTSLTGASPSEPFHYPSKVIVNESNGDLLVLDNDEEAGVIYVFEPSAPGEYTLVRKITGPSASGSLKQPFNLAVDSDTGDIYVTERFFPTTIAQYSPAGTFLGRITGFDSPRGDISDVYSLTVDSTTRDVYVADNKVGVDVFGPAVVIPDVTTRLVSALKTRSATLAGTVDPDKEGSATCQFVWGTSVELGNIAPCTAPVGEGESPVPVEAQLSELEPDRTYYYRLQATDHNGTNLGESSQTLHFTTPGPRLDAEAVSDVAAESVTFDATVNPHLAPTTYYVQYGTTDSYGTDLPAPPGAVVGAGEGDVEFSQHVQGLQADTIYHYRVVQISEVEAGKEEEFDGPDQTFTTQLRGGELSLPDDRSWELVTPPDKHGALFYGQNRGHTTTEAFTAQAAAAGDAMINLASAPTESQPQGYANEVSVLSTRDAGGWSSQVIAPPHNEGTGPSIDIGGEYHFFSEDLSQGIVLPFGNFTPLSPEATEGTPYLRTDYLNGNLSEHCQTSCYRPLVTAANTRSGAVFGEEINGECAEQMICAPRFVDATPDASHIVLSSPVQLTVTPNEQAEGTRSSRFYEWAGGQLQPLYPLPTSEGGTGVYAGQLSPVDHQLSDNGNVFFTHGGHLYVHDFAKDNSVRLDVAEGVQEPSEGAAKFLYASSDGSRILFSDSRQLTGVAGGGIYECQIVEVAGDLKCQLELTGLAGGKLIGASEDASYVYFLAADDKLIVGRDGEGGWSESNGPFVGEHGLIPASEGTQDVYRLSPNGHYLTFMSSEDLTGYDTHDARNSETDQEVYLYEADTNKLVCASCNPTGARPVGVENDENELVGGESVGGESLTGRWVASNLPPWTRANATGYGKELYQPRFLFNSGRLFFDSNDALVPQDVNGTQDAYEFEPPNVGGCSTSSVTYSERSGGCVDLISSGASPEESAFMDASNTGGDVFFITQAKLLSQDFDNAFDVYDARECAVATPCYPQVPVSPPACSTGDSCKMAPSLQPSIFGPTPSATFSGAGNVVSAGSAPAVRQKSLSRAQKLTRALKACRKKGHKQRAVCERKARKRYAPVGKSRKAGAKQRGKG